MNSVLNSQHQTTHIKSTTLSTTNSLTSCVNFTITTKFFPVKIFPNKAIAVIIQDICLHWWHSQFAFGLKAISRMCSHFLWNHSKHTSPFTICMSKFPPSKLDQLIQQLQYKFRNIVFSLFFVLFLMIMETAPSCNFENKGKDVFLI